MHTFNTVVLCEYLLLMVATAIFGIDKSAPISSRIFGFIFITLTLLVYGGVRYFLAILN